MKFGRVGVKNDEYPDQHEDGPQDMFRGDEILPPDMEKDKTEAHFGCSYQACVSSTGIAEAEEDQAVIENAEEERGPQYVS